MTHYVQDDSGISGISGSADMLKTAEVGATKISSAKSLPNLDSNNPLPVIQHAPSGGGGGQQAAAQAAVAMATSSGNMTCLPTVDEDRELKLLSDSNSSLTTSRLGKAGKGHTDFFGVSKTLGGIKKSKRNFRLPGKRFLSKALKKDSMLCLAQ